MTNLTCLTDLKSLAKLTNFKMTVSTQNKSKGQLKMLKWSSGEKVMVGNRQNEQEEEEEGRLS